MAFRFGERLQKCLLGVAHGAAAVSLRVLSRRGQRDEIRAPVLRGTGSLNQPGAFQVVDDGDDRGAVDAESLPQNLLAHRSFVGEDGQRRLLLHTGAHPRERIGFQLE